MVRNPKPRRFLSGLRARIPLHWIRFYHNLIIIDRLFINLKTKLNPESNLRIRQ